MTGDWFRLCGASTTSSGNKTTLQPRKMLGKPLFVTKSTNQASLNSTTVNVFQIAYSDRIVNRATGERNPLHDTIQNFY